MPFLKNKNISLRALEKEDLNFLYETENNQSIHELGSTLMPHSKYILRDFIKNADKDIYINRQLRLVVEHNKSCESVGMIDLFNFEPHHQRSEIGIIINEDYQRKGYGNEALESLIQYAFETLHMHQLYCHIAINNLGSIHLFEKAGFTLSGQLKDWVRGKNKNIDVLVYQKLNKNKEK